MRHLNSLNPFLIVQQRRHGLNEIILLKPLTQYLANNMHLIYTAIRLADNIECLLCARACAEPREAHGVTSALGGPYCLDGTLVPRQRSTEINMSFRSGSLDSLLPVQEGRGMLWGRITGGEDYFVWRWSRTASLRRWHLDRNLEGKQGMASYF